MHMCFSLLLVVFFFKQKTAYEVRISDWSSDVCSSDLFERAAAPGIAGRVAQFVAVEDAHPDLDEEAEDAARDQQRPEARDHEIDLQAHIIELPQPPRHAHPPEHVARPAVAPEARHPQPPRDLPPFGPRPAAGLIDQPILA